MTVLFVTADGKKCVKYSGSGPSSYPSGGFTVTVSELNMIDDVLEVEITGGYVAKCEESLPKVNNTLTIKVYQQTSVSGALPEVPDGTDLSGQTVKALVLGT